MIAVRVRPSSCGLCGKPIRAGDRLDFYCPATAESDTRREIDLVLVHRDCK